MDGRTDRRMDRVITKVRPLSKQGSNKPDQSVMASCVVSFSSDNNPVIIVCIEYHCIIVCIEPRRLQVCLYCNLSSDNS